MARGSDDQETGTIYLRIADGKIIEQVEPDTPGAIKRTTKPSKKYPDGRDVWERRDEYVDGIITSMYHTEREYEGETFHELVIRLRDVDEHYSIKVNRGNKYWTGIMMRLPKLDLQKPVRFKPYDFESKDDKRRVIGINLFQGGVKIDPAWTKTEPGDLPQGRQVMNDKGKPVMVNGRALWDFEERDAYLLKVFGELTDQQRLGDQAMEGTKDTARPDQIPDTDDDMPF